MHTYGDRGHVLISKIPMPTKKTSTKTSSKKSSTQETFTVKGEDLLKRVQELIKEGNIRRITIKNKEGKTLLVIPLTIGVVGVVLLPVWAAIGAMAALVTECSITVERNEE